MKGRFNNAQAHARIHVVLSYFWIQNPGTGSPFIRVDTIYFFEEVDLIPICAFLSIALWSASHTSALPLSSSLAPPFPLHMSPNIQPMESHSFQDDHGVRHALLLSSPPLSLPLLPPLYTSPWTSDHWKVILSKMNTECVAHSLSTECVTHSTLLSLSPSPASPFPLHMSPNIQPMESHSFQDDQRVEFFKTCIKHIHLYITTLSLFYTNSFIQIITLSTMARFAFTVALHKVNSKTGKETTHDHKKLESLYNVKGKVVKHDATIYLIRRGMSSLKREYEEDSFLFKRRFSPSEFKDFRTNVVVMAKMTDGSTKVYHEFEDAHAQPLSAFMYIGDFKRRCLKMKETLDSGVEYIYMAAKPTGSDKYIHLGGKTVIGVSSFSTSEKPECDLSELVNETFSNMKRKLKSSETKKVISTPYGNFLAYGRVHKENEGNDKIDVDTYKVIVHTHNSNSDLTMTIDEEIIEVETSYYKVKDGKRVKINYE